MEQNQTKELELTFLEEYGGGISELEKKRYKNSAILLSKAAFALCDMLLFEKLKRLPKNHSERFRLLEEYFNDIYQIVDNMFSYYTDAYSRPIVRETCEEIKNGIKKIAKIGSLSEEIKKAIE